MKAKINQIIRALMVLEDKGCHAVFFEYGNGLFRVRIFKGEVHEEKALYQRVINPVRESAELDRLLDFINNLNSHITTVPFPCYKREYLKMSNNRKMGEWEKTKFSFEVGNNATTSMLIDGSGYYINDPDNGVQYFVDISNNQ